MLLESTIINYNNNNHNNNNNDDDNDNDDDDDDDVMVIDLQVRIAPNTIYNYWQPPAYNYAHTTMRKKGLMCLHFCLKPNVQRFNYSVITSGGNNTNTYD